MHFFNICRRSWNVTTAKSGGFLYIKQNKRQTHNKPKLNGEPIKTEIQSVLFITKSKHKTFAANNYHTQCQNNSQKNKTYITVASMATD